ncbi:hypothetical protein ACIA5A_15225 [Micromonospora sp. NPDC051300]|uniref:hypothetical protein n=1 Tax=Micromonospora sp. NPDC051300 TaxID=3364286 RepID=UPI00379497A5
MRDALRRWAADRGAVRVLSRKGPMRGYTEAYLFVVKLDSPAGPGRVGSRKLLVKVHPAGGDGPSGARRHEQAQRDAPGFAERHMVRPHFGGYPVSDGRHLSFQDLANGGDAVRTLDQVEDDDRLVEAYRTVVGILLHDWNGVTAPAGPPTATTTVREYVRRELAATGALREVAARAGRLGLDDLDRDRLDVDGRERPNPLRLTEDGGPVGDVEIEYVHGFSHGDLHGGNLLFAARRDGTVRPQTFTIVDLDRYESAAPLTRDLVTLLVSTVLRWVAPRPGPDGDRPDGLPRKQAVALLDYLVDPDRPAPSSLPPALAELVRLTHEEGSRYAASGNWREDWGTQYRLSLVAQALTAVTYDNLDHEGRWWCFRLAAYAAEAIHAELTDADTRFDPTPVLDLHVDRAPERWHGTAEPGRHRAGGGLPRNAAPAGTDSDGVGRPVAHRNRGRYAAVSRPGAVLRRWVGLPAGGSGRRRLTMAVLAALGGSLVAQLVPGSTSDRDLRPPVAVPPPSRTETPPSSRSGDRGPVPSEPLDPGAKLVQIADRVQRMTEPPSRGRYAFTCLRVWSPEDLALGSDDLMRYQEERLWWTRERSGRRTVHDVDDGRRSRAQDARYDRGELRAVPPDPSADLTELRRQMDALLRAKPPVLRNAAGMLETVAWINQFRPLTAGQRAALLRWLAEQDGIVDGGRYGDRAQRYGYAVSARNADGQWETLLFDEDTGRLLSHVKTTADDTLLAYYLFLDSARTDTIEEAPCGDPATVSIDG